MTLCFPIWRTSKSPQTQRFDINLRPEQVLGAALRARGYKLSDQTIAQDINRLTKDGRNYFAAACEVLGGVGVSFTPVSIDSLDAIDAKELATSDYLLFSKSGRFFNYKAVSASEVSFAGRCNRNVKASRSAVDADWDGICLVIVGNGQYEEFEYFSRRLKDVWSDIKWRAFSGGIVLTSLAGALFHLFVSPSLSEGLIVSVAGFSAAICASMVRTEFAPDPGQKILMCSKDDNYGCHAVLASKYSKLLGASLAELGLVYFAGVILCFAVTGTYSALLLAVLVLTGFVAPWSIYTQTVKLGRLCRACLVIGGSLVVIAGAAGWILAHSVTGSDVVQNSPTDVLLLALPFLVWVLIKPLLKAEIQYQKRQAVPFDEVAGAPTKQTLTLSTDDMKPVAAIPALSLSNHAGPETQVWISLDCSHCHQVLHYLIELQRNDLLAGRVDLRLLAFSETGTPSFKVAQHVLGLERTHGSSESIPALSSWFEAFAPNRFEEWKAEQNPLGTSDLSGIEEDLKITVDLFETLNLAATPTILFRQSGSDQFEKVASISRLRSEYYKANRAKQSDHV